MPDRIDPRKIKAKFTSEAVEPALSLVRAAEGGPQSSELREVFAQAGTLDVRAEARGHARIDMDADQVRLINKAVRDLRLPQPTTTVMSDTVDVPGNTLRLGLDSPFRVNAFNPDHVYRSENGQGSFVRLRRWASDSYSGYAAYWATPPGGITTGVYLAVVHVEGDITDLHVEPGTVDESFYSNVKRSGTKFLIPFEVTKPAPFFCLGMTFVPEVVGTLTIYHADLTRVS